MKALDGWKHVVRSRDVTRLTELLDPDVVFESPVLHTPQIGRDVTARYLAAAVDVLGGERFGFVEEWRNDHGAALEFKAELEGVMVNGVDLITVSADGERIIGFKVMLRPLKALDLVRERMTERLGRRS